MKKNLIFITTLLLLNLSTIYAQNFPDQEWERIEHPTFFGWDAYKLNTLRDYIIDSTAITGMVVIQDGKMVFEYGNLSENSYIASCRKSIPAMLYGKYVMNGTINLDKTLSELNLAESELLLENESEASIRNIISARSGIYLPASNRGDFLHLAPKRGSIQPGEYWLYSNYDFNMAGHIFEKETKHSIYDEIESQFAIPLHMQDWDRGLQEKSGDALVSDHMAYHMWFSVRDMARLGWMLVNNGKWNDTQVLDSNWIEEMTSPTTSFAEVDKIAPFMKDKWAKFGYGYMWWLWDKPENNYLRGAYSALGAWGQNLTILPEMNTVLVIKTNSTYGRRKGNHNFIVSSLTKIYDADAAIKLKPLATSLQAGDIDLFLNNISSLNSANQELDVEGEINSIGYTHLFDGDIESAIKFFKYNVVSHPHSWNVYDSLAEAYFMKKDYEKAFINYKKAIELNTDNEGGNNDRLEHVMKRIKLKMTKR